MNTKTVIHSSCLRFLIVTILLSRQLSSASRNSLDTPINYDIDGETQKEEILSLEARREMKEASFDGPRLSQEILSNNINQQVRNYAYVNYAYPKMSLTDGSTNLKMEFLHKGAATNSDEITSPFSKKLNRAFFTNKTIKKPLTKIKSLRNLLTKSPLKKLILSKDAATSLTSNSATDGFETSKETSKTKQRDNISQPKGVILPLYDLPRECSTHDVSCSKSGYGEMNDAYDASLHKDSGRDNDGKDASLDDHATIISFSNVINRPKDTPQVTDKDDDDLTRDEIYSNDDLRRTFPQRTEFMITTKNRQRTGGLFNLENISENIFKTFRKPQLKKLISLKASSRNPLSFLSADRSSAIAVGNNVDLLSVPPAGGATSKNSLAEPLPLPPPTTPPLLPHPPPSSSSSPSSVHALYKQKIDALLHRDDPIDNFSSQKQYNLITTLKKLSNVDATHDIIKDVNKPFHYKQNKVLKNKITPWHSMLNSLRMTLKYPDEQEENTLTDDRQGKASIIFTSNFIPAVQSGTKRLSISSSTTLPRRDPLISPTASYLLTSGYGQDVGSRPSPLRGVTGATGRDYLPFLSTRSMMPTSVARMERLQRSTSRNRMRSKFDSLHQTLKTSSFLHDNNIFDMNYSNLEFLPFKDILSKSFLHSLRLASKLPHSLQLKLPPSSSAKYIDYVPFGNHGNFSFLHPRFRNRTNKHTHTHEMEENINESLSVGSKKNVSQHISLPKVQESSANSLFLRDLPRLQKIIKKIYVDDRYKFLSLTKSVNHRVSIRDDAIFQSDFAPEKTYTEAERLSYLSKINAGIDRSLRLSRLNAGTEKSLKLSRNTPVTRSRKRRALMKTEAEKQTSPSQLRSRLLEPSSSSHLKANDTFEVNDNRPKLDLNSPLPLRKLERLSEDNNTVMKVTTHIPSEFDSIHTTEKTSVHKESHILKAFASHSERQFASLNPLQIEQPKETKPLPSLSTTSLSRPEHPNIFYLNASRFSQPTEEPTTRTPTPLPPHIPTHQEGGPVDPAQLILLNSNARPIAPGRPASNVVAVPSAVNPETFLVPTESPLSISLVRNKTNSLVSDNGVVPVDPDTVQISVSQEGEQVDPSPFFAGRPSQPNYVFTTLKPVVLPVNPANLLVASGHTTRPPITIPPPGFNPLLSNLQRLDKVEYNETAVTDIALSFPTRFPPRFPLDETQEVKNISIQEDSNHPLPIGSNAHVEDISNNPKIPPVIRIPGAVPVIASPDLPFVVSNNTVINVHDVDPILNLTDISITHDILQSIANLHAASQQTVAPVTPPTYHPASPHSDKINVTEVEAAIEDIQYFLAAYPPNVSHDKNISEAQTTNQYAPPEILGNSNLNDTNIDSNAEVESELQDSTIQFPFQQHASGYPLSAQSLNPLQYPNSLQPDFGIGMSQHPQNFGSTLQNISPLGVPQHNQNLGFTLPNISPLGVPPHNQNPTSTLQNFPHSVISQHQQNPTSMQNISPLGTSQLQQNLGPTFQNFSPSGMSQQQQNIASTLQNTSPLGVSQQQQSLSSTFHNHSPFGESQQHQNIVSTLQNFPPPQLQQRPFLPNNANNFGANLANPSFPQFFSPYPYNLGQRPDITRGNGEISNPTASVTASVQDKASSANSTAEGSEGFISTSTTVIKGGTSISNNNFFRPRPQQPVTPRIPVAPPPPISYLQYAPNYWPRPEFVSQPNFPAPSPVQGQPPTTQPHQRPLKPTIIVDGVQNETALPSHVFPGSQINVACSRRHGCPTFILRSRPSDPEPIDNQRNTHIFDEANAPRPKGNINIQCDFEEGCPTYIINTTPSPQATTTTVVYEPSIVESATEEPPQTPSSEYGELLEALETIINFLNITESQSIQNDHQSLTGIFDGLIDSASFQALHELPAPEINPQNIQPNLQIFPFDNPSTTPNSLLEHISSQRRPSYETLRVPQNTVLRSPSFYDLLDNRQHFQINPLLTKSNDNTQSDAEKLLGQPGSIDLLRNQLIQSHLEALQNSDIGVLPLDPLEEDIVDKQNIRDLQMGGAEVTERPLAAILNLEPLDIPNEPPLVTSEDSHHHGHHDSMMRRVLGAAVVGLPITTALLGALGAPAAIMAPIGLALPALFTMGFMDADGGAISLLGHQHHHNHNRRHTQTAPTNSFSSPNTASTVHPETREGAVQSSNGHVGSSSNIYDEGPSHHSQSNPTLFDGGGIGGAITRLAGVVPMLASKLYDQISRIRRRRRKRRQAGDEIPASSSAPYISQHHLNTIENLNRYYSSLADSSPGERPSPEEVKLHRKYLLNLLQEIRRSNAASDNKENEVIDQERNISTEGAQEVFASSSEEPPLIHEDDYVNSEDASGNEPVPEDGGSSPSSQFANKMGQAGASDNTDIQNLGIEEAALLIHQLQTQGNVKILPAKFATPSSSGSQHQQIRNVFRNQQAINSLGSPVNSNIPSGSPIGSNMEQQTRPAAPTSTFQDGLRLALLNAALSNGLRVGNLNPRPSGENPAPSVILGEPSQFSDFGGLATVNTTRLSSPGSPNVVMVDGADFQEIRPNAPLASSFFIGNASIVDRFEPVPATIQNTRITTELTTALTNFVNNIADAINQLITDLQAAIAANPAVALLLLLPLLLLPYLFQKFGHGGGYGGGGYGHRRVSYQPTYSRSIIAEDLARKILKDIDTYERYFMSDEEYLTDRSGYAS